MAFPPGDPRIPPQVRNDLPPLPRDDVPLGYRPGRQVRERLAGLGLVILGFVGMGIVYVMYTAGGFLHAPPPPAPPPGLRGLPMPPIINVTNIIMPLMVIGSAGVIMVGIRRMIDP